MHNFIDEKFWLAIAFFAFVVLILRHVWPILSRKIAEQSSQIAADLLKAKEMKEEAEKLLQEARKQLDDSAVRSKKLLNDAEDEAKKLLDDSKLQIEKEVERKMTALNNRVKSEEEKILRDIKVKVISEAFKDIESSLQGEKQDNVVKGALESISKVVH